MTVLRMIMSLIFIAALFGCAKSQFHTNQTDPAENALQFYGAKYSLVSWRSIPVFIGDWDGKREPFTLSGNKITPLLPERYRSGISGLIDPVVLSNDELLLTNFLKIENSDAPRSIYVFNAASSQLAEIPELQLFRRKAFCVFEKSRLITWTDSQKNSWTSTITPSGRLLNSHAVMKGTPPIQSCMWVDSTHRLSIHKRTGAWVINYCSVSAEGRESCKFLKRSDSKSIRPPGFWQNPTGTSGVLMYSPREKKVIPFRFSESKAALEPLPHLYKGPESVRAFDGKIMLLSFHSRTFLNVAPDAPYSVTSFAKVGHDIYALVDGPNFSETIARLSEGVWKPIFFKSDFTPPDFPSEEIWLRSSQGHYFQGFYHGFKNRDKVVLFLMGIGYSPGNAYSPYFDALHKAGYGVLVLYYPGYPGRGPRYSHGDQNVQWLLEAAKTADEFLWSNGFRRVVVWAISAGNVPGSQFLENGTTPISGFVDYFSHYKLQQHRTKSSRLLARERGIVYLTVRAAHDIPDPEPADIMLQGGHLEDPPPPVFQKMEDTITGAMDQSPVMPPFRYEDKAALMIDPIYAGEDVAPDKDYFVGPQNFELAYHIADQCSQNGNAQLTTFGYPPLHSRNLVLDAEKPLLQIASSKDSKPAVTFGTNALPAAKEAAKLFAKSLRYPLRSGQFAGQCTVKVNLGPGSSHSPNWIETEDGVIFRKDLLKLAGKFCDGISKLSVCGKTGATPEGQNH